MRCGFGKSTSNFRADQLFFFAGGNNTTGAAERDCNLQGRRGRCGRSAGQTATDADTGTNRSNGQTCGLCCADQRHPDRRKLSTISPDTVRSSPRSDGRSQSRSARRRFRPNGDNSARRFDRKPKKASAFVCKREVDFPKLTKRPTAAACFQSVYKDRPPARAVGKRSFLPRFRNSVIIIPANCAFCVLNCAKCLFVAIQEPTTKNVICTQMRTFYVLLRVCNCAITKKAILL